ncbi:MAG TPA: hypothetical protein VLB32_02620 [Candidatus Acidoferrales bacterium]|nr:hypothetical protein [Candidatus Acidoferrales bacterium]
MNGMPELDRLQKAALIAGGVAAVLCVVGAVMTPHQFYRSYLVGFLFWTGISLGCFAVLLLHHIFGAAWGFVVQRTLEAGTRTLPLMAVLFLPLLLGMHALYEWTHAEVVAGDPVLQQKSVYLNTGFFVGRAVFYFLVWIGIATLLNRWSQQLDASGAPELAARLSNSGPPGLLLYGFTVTFATVDWVMSVDPHWYSTIFALIFIAGQVLSTIAFAILMTRLLGERPPLAGVLRPAHLHDLGNLMFAFTMIWAYVSFSQFLIIWSGNLPETITWYKARSEGGWQWVAVGLFLFSFALPFVILLSRWVKQRARLLARVAAWVLFMRLVELFWIVQPSFRPNLSLHWLDVAAPIAVGGFWLAFYIRQLKSRPLLPERDPRMHEAFADVHAH